MDEYHSGTGWVAERNTAQTLENQHVAEIETVIVIATADAPGAPSGPGRASFWVEDGTVRRIEAPVGVER
jgi:hypothetical protein